MKERNQEIHVLFLPDKMGRLKQKMAEVGIINRSTYVRKMALDGHRVNLDLTDMKEMVSLLRRCSNDLNQYAKRANDTGKADAAVVYFSVTGTTRGINDNRVIGFVGYGDWGEELVSPGIAATEIRMKMVR